MAVPVGTPWNSSPSPRRKSTLTTSPSLTLYWRDPSSMIAYMPGWSPTGGAKPGEIAFAREKETVAGGRETDQGAAHFQRRQRLLSLQLDPLHRAVEQALRDLLPLPRRRTFGGEVF